MTRPENAAGDSDEPVTVTDKRRIDPQTGEVREGASGPAPSGPAPEAPASRALTSAETTNFSSWRVSLRALRVTSTSWASSA